MRLEYGDGRDDYEQTLWTLTTPRRLWAVVAILSSAVLYGLVPWLSRPFLDEGNLSAAWSQILSVLSRASVWNGLMLVILATWLAALISDRLQLWTRERHLRPEIAGRGPPVPHPGRVVSRISTDA